MREEKLIIYNPQEFSSFNYFEIREVKYDTREYQIDVDSFEFDDLKREMKQELVEEIITKRALQRLNPYIEQDLGTKHFQIIASDKFYFHINKRIQFRIRVEFKIDDFQSKQKREVIVEKYSKSIE